MTAQIPERLHHQGHWHEICNEPLGMYFELLGQAPRFRETLSALWRCYIGSWEIRDGRLYLVGLAAELADGAPATLATVFPGFPDRVFAHWYTGTLRIPEGGRLACVHMGYASTFERDLLLEIERGLLRSSRVRHNGVASAETPGGERVQAAPVIGPMADDPEPRQ
jgi:hypothetical protein